MSIGCNGGCLLLEWLHRAHWYPEVCKRDLCWWHCVCWERLHSHKKLCVLGPDGGVLSFKPFKLFLVFPHLGCESGNLSCKVLCIARTCHVAWNRVLHALSMSDRLLEPHGGHWIVEMEFYNFEFWAANNLQNQKKGRRSPLGHRGGAGQRGSGDQVNVCSYNQYNNERRVKVNN